ncbi:MAG: hypothetical protein WCD68_15315, partial [Candidatus Acidiferrum sp.]
PSVEFTYEVRERSRQEAESTRFRAERGWCRRKYDDPAKLIESEKASTAGLASVATPDLR